MRNLSPKLLKADQRGLAAFLKREGEQLPDRQYVRELVQNAFDADATSVLIDVVDFNGKPKLRFSDNGHGMSDTQLEEHLSTLHQSGSGRSINFGVGARLATLSRNPLGVIWASTQNRRSGQVYIAETRDGYSMLPFETEDGGQSYVVQAEAGILPAFVSEAGHGTSVLLMGSIRHRTTGSPTRCASAGTYLSNRYWRFPDGTRVSIQNADGSVRRVRPMRDNVLRHAQASGTVRVRGDLPGTIEWYLLPPEPERDHNTGSYVRSTLAARHEDELFECPDDSRMWPAFGVPLRSVRSRLVIIVEPDGGVSMNTSRTALVRPRGRGLPWTDWGRQFAEQLPAEIAELMEQLRPVSTLDQDVLNRFPNWAQKVQRTLAYRPKPNGSAQAIEQVGNSRIEGQGDEFTGHDTDRPVREPAPKRRSANARRGDHAAEEIRLPNPPQVVWIPEHEWGLLPFWVNYDRGSNVVFMLETMPPVRAEIDGRAAETGLPESALEPIVRDAYGMEMSFKVLHVLTLDEQRGGYRWSAEQISDALTPSVLTAAITGMNAVGAEIDKKVKELSRRGEL